MLSKIAEFLGIEAAGGIVLVIVTVTALTAANSPASSAYVSLVEMPLFGKTFVFWVNDALMTPFFLLVGLEIKREVVEGELSSLRLAALPAVAALGGVAIPALLYAVCASSEPAALHGWAIPCATDIAFAVGILALFGKSVPRTLGIFLLALAIIDDLAVIVIIAFFYTDELSLLPLFLAAVCLAALIALNFAGTTRIALYAIVGLLLWICVFASGIHPTLAGVAVAFCIPLRTADDGGGEGLLQRIEHGLHPWVTWGVMPVFAFANAGVPLTGLSIGSLLEPVPLGIALGLFLGKQSGVVGATWLALRLRIGTLPAGATWPQFYGMAVLTGIGFTMSLFIGALAFEEPGQDVPVRVGVLVGSLLSAIVGSAILLMARTKEPVPLATQSP